MHPRRLVYIFLHYLASCKTGCITCLLVSKLALAKLHTFSGKKKSLLGLVEIYHMAMWVYFVLAQSLPDGEVTTFFPSVVANTEMRCGDILKAVLQHMGSCTCNILYEG